jgi:hypothetical protein
MKKLVAAAVLALVAAPTVRAADMNWFGPSPLSVLNGSSSGGGPTVRSATIDPRSGTVVPAVTRLHPVIGSLQRTGHFTNPFTHKTKYTGTVYNPALGTFGTQKFRR